MYTSEGVLLAAVTILVLILILILVLVLVLVLTLILLLILILIIHNKLPPCFIAEYRLVSLPV